MLDFEFSNEETKRMRFFKCIMLLTAAFSISGCVSVSSLPQSAVQADFNREKEGKTGWAKWEDAMHISGVDMRTAYMAAKSGLGNAGFIVKKGSFNSGCVIGEHGITAEDWNIVAGVYLRPDQTGVLVKLIVEGSKDLGFEGDTTAANWVELIFGGMREYILQESLITNPNRKIFN